MRHPALLFVLAACGGPTAGSAGPPGGGNPTTVGTTADQTHDAGAQSLQGGVHDSKIH